MRKLQESGAMGSTETIVVLKLVRKNKNFAFLARGSTETIVVLKLF